MAMDQNRRIGLALDLVSFIIERLSREELDRLRSVILFGSTARGEARDDSDLDLYFDVDPDPELTDKIRRYRDEFLESVKCTKYWELMGEIPQIQTVIGEVDGDESLLPALLADGIVVYGPYQGEAPSGQPMVLVTWSGVTSRNTKTNLYRKLYGYSLRGQRYPGLVEQVEGEKLNPGCLLIPVRALKTIRGLFRELEVPVRVRTVQLT